MTNIMMAAIELGKLDGADNGQALIYAVLFFAGLIAALLGLDK